jgi:hypothetical protein
MVDASGNFTLRARGLDAAIRQNVGEASGDLPSFFVIGPPRTGTTWLHEVLKNHAQLPSSSKETRFFDKHFHYGIAWYRAHYGKRMPGRSIGEIAPTYFASAVARERIARIAPWAKVICIFRNPVERVLSLYRVKRAYGLIPWDLEEAMVRDPELHESSRYATNLRVWQAALKPSQVLACLYDELEENPQSFVNTLAAFIGIPSFTLTPAQIEYVASSDSLTHPRSYYRTRGATLMADWLKARRFGNLVASVKNSPVRRFLLGGGSPFAELPLEFSRKLYEMFRCEVEQLEVLLHRDLSAWKFLSLAQK